MHALTTYEVQQWDKAGVFLEPSGAIIVRLADPHDSTHNPAVRVPPHRIDWLEDLVQQVANVLAAREMTA